MKDERNLMRMLELIKKIRLYCASCSYEQFEKEGMLTEACVFNLTQLGEVAHKMSDEFVELHPEVAWRELYGLRNRLVHDYQGVNLRLVWEIITDDLSGLEKQLEELI